MNRIDELIERLCPDGVEYRTLGEIGEFIRGSGIQKKDFVDEGVGCIHYGQLYTHYGLSAKETKSFITKEFATNKRMAHEGNLVIATTSENEEDVCRAVAWLGGEDVAVSNDAYIYRHNQNPMYIAYFFNSSSFASQKKPYITGTKVLRVSGENLAKIVIPVPPKEIQEEIVKVLDSFAELEAELEARRAQYAYYRDKLLDFGSRGGAFWMPLGEALVMKAGGSIRACDIFDVKDEINSIPCFGGNGIRGFVKEPNQNDDAVLIGRQGALCGNVQFAKAPFYATEHAVVARPKTDMNLRYLYHVLVVADLAKYKTAGAQPGLSVQRLERVCIPVPAPEEQEYIVSTLDKFDALVGDISEGLPSEIEARRRQYEHYRDKLLSFKEKIA